MKPTPFDPETDLAPVPFGEAYCEAAAQLKEKGLSWRPHVGCFVWDPDGHIEVRSPFPGRVYFILNLGHFLRIFGNADTIAEKLVWLPTHHQARLLCDQLGIDTKEIQDTLCSDRVLITGDELLCVYGIISRKLQEISGLEEV